MRVREDGKSESRLVIERIRVAPKGNITLRESGLTSVWSFFTRELEKLSKKGKADPQGYQFVTAGNIPAGAPFHAEVNWSAINWRKVHQNVRRLQARIVKAIQEKRWGKVKALQHLLTHSFSGKVLAVRRVTENQGKRTAGIDGATWSTSQQKALAVPSLRQHGYRAQPLKRVYIPKRNGQKRPLGIPTMTDRAMQALFKLALEPIAESLADPNSYGFRPERSTADAIEKCFKCLHRPGSTQWVLEGDIKGCFDHINHDWLLNHIPLDKSILKQWLKAGFMEKRAWYPTHTGTPQGGIISPLLANLCLDGLETKLNEQFPPRSQRGRTAQLHLVRYADDFIITGSSREILQLQVKPLVEQFLQERGLQLSPEKTKVTHIATGFDFLGQHLRKFNGKLIIKPAQESVKSLLQKVRLLIKANPMTPVGLLLRRLNPILRGWANYHRHVVSQRTFKHIDNQVSQMLWRWAKRRHPRKSSHWLKPNYFRAEQGRNWVFHGKLPQPNGPPTLIRLFKTHTIPIQRHRKIKAEANPYDPQWERYFEQRLDLKMAANLKGQATLLFLWRQQKGRCPVCQQKITDLTGWHSHHILWRSKGGSDTADNRALLHPLCHSQVHSQDLKVGKPRP